MQLLLHHFLRCAASVLSREGSSLLIFVSCLFLPLVHRLLLILDIYCVILASAFRYQTGKHDFTLRLFRMWHRLSRLPQHGHTAHDISFHCPMETLTFLSSRKFSAPVQEFSSWIACSALFQYRLEIFTNFMHSEIIYTSTLIITFQSLFALGVLNPGCPPMSFHSAFT